MSRSVSSTLRMGIGPARGRLDRTMSEALELSQSGAPLNSEEHNRQVQSTINVLPRLESQIQTLTNANQRWMDLITALDDDDAAHAEEKIYKETAYGEHGYMDLVMDATETANVLRMRLDRMDKSMSVGNAPVDSSIHPKQHQEGAYKTNMRLPKLQLPTFSGDYLHWEHFWQIFRINIHDTSLSNVEKFSYLRPQLSGAALASIDGLSLSEENYDIAVAILQSRFDRPPRQLIGSYYSQLKKMPPSSNKIHDLQRTFDACEKIFRLLEKAGEDLSTNQALVLEVFSKYPNHVIERLFNHRGINATSTLSEVRNGLSEYIKGAESLSEIFEELKPFSASTKLDRPPSDNQKQFLTDATSALTTANTPSTVTSSQLKNNPQNPCYFCGGAHFNAECTKYPTSASRIERLKMIGRCTRCFSQTHSFGDCRTPAKMIKCFFCKNTGNHRSPLCPDRFAKQTATFVAGQSHDPGLPPVNAVETQASTLLNSDESALLLTAVTSASNPITGESLQLRLVFDTGSHRTYVTERCAKSLKLASLKADAINVAVFGTKRTLTVHSRAVELSITLRDGSTKLLRANTTPIISSTSILPDRFPPSTQQWLGTVAGELADDFTKSGDIDILVGSDYFWEFITGNRIPTAFGIYLIPSSLGLLLSGRYVDDNPHQASLLCLTEKPYSNMQRDFSPSQLTNHSNAPDVEEFWELERIGIFENPLDDDDSVALEQFNKTVYFNEGRYYVKWPWKHRCDNLPTNYNLALGRFRSLSKRLNSCSNDVKARCHEVIDDQVRKGVIEKVDLTQSTNNQVHYLPHHPVIRPSSTTTKVRIVYDASAKARSDTMSLNECLHRGPVMLPDLCAILIRFRLKAVAIVADIEKAFLQMALQLEDRDVTRFFWFDDPEIKSVDGNTAVFRFCRVPFGVISSPFLLAATIQYHLKCWKTPVADEIGKNIYVDNVISTLNNADEAMQFYQEGKAIFNAAGMNLTGWCSNAPRFDETIAEDDRSMSKEVKVLGLHWDNKLDTLALNEPKNWKRKCETTKREVLRKVAAIYDPLGLFQPVTLNAKRFLRQLWLKNCQWDELLNEADSKQWNTIHSDMDLFWEVSLSRHNANIDCDSTMIVFCDASADAYAAAVYIRSKFGDRWETNIVFAKSRLSPKSRNNDKVSIPRLELLGVLIGMRAAKFIRHAIENEGIPVIVFTDSTCVLAWLQTNKLLSAFVSHRVDEIKSLPNAEFGHVRSEENPADICTRGLSAVELSKRTLWWEGPPWLKHDRCDWPTKTNYCPLNQLDSMAVDSEMKGQQVFHTLLSGKDLSEQPKVYPLGMDLTRFSGLQRLLRVTTICLKFVNRKVWQQLPSATQMRFRKPIANFFSKISNETFITASDINIAKMMWLESVQSHAFGPVKTAILENKHHPLVKQLCLVIDNGLIRCSGRMKFADISSGAVNPFLLPKKHYFTDLVIRQVHAKQFHSGVAHTLSQIRRQYWIPCGRSCVRRAITRCYICKRNKGPPFALPQMPPWPRERLSRSSPFQFTGLDYLGPVTVSVNGEVHKMWICLFTCMSTRAVHLEWARDCSSQSFVDCLSRFISRRGSPEQIISDNAPQFRTVKKLVDRTWHSVFVDNATTTYISNRGIRWKFTTELAPWQGGFYERLVGLVKRTLNSVVGRRLLKWDEFITILTESEAIVNSRPLTYVYEDFKSGFVLRPCDFLADLPTGTPDVDSFIPPEGGDASKLLLRHWKYKQRRLNTLWAFWRDEYLLSLRERGTVDHRQPRVLTKGIPYEGQIVLIKNDGSPRGSWKFGRVAKVISSSDNSVRSAEVILPNRITIRRPISHLYSMELPQVATNSKPRIDEPSTSDMPSTIESGETGEEDGFSGFSESEVYGYQGMINGANIEPLSQNNLAIIAAINSQLANNAVTIAFEACREA